MGLTRRNAIGAACRTALAASLAFVLGAASGGPVPAPRPVKAERVAAAASAERPQSMRHSGIAGWIVIDLDTGEVLDEHEADHPFAPASVAKLPTAIYALDRLGPDFRFETKVVAGGAVQGGTLNGDLILQGGGDPELDTDALLPLVTQLGERGIKRVAGAFLVDGSAAPRLEAIDPDQPVDAAYNPSVSGLSLNFNRVRLKWNARGKSKLLRVSAQGDHLDPDVGGVQVMLADYSGDPIFTHSLEGGNEVWHMSQSGFRGEGARWLPVRRPELYAGEVFASLAKTGGIGLAAARQGPAPEGGDVIARVESRALAPMLASMLRYSTNLSAELVGFAASRAGGAAPATIADSAAAMNAWAAGLAGFAPGDPGFRMANHSGLSTESRVSPRRLAEFLRAAALRHPEPSRHYPRLPGGVSDLIKEYNIAVKTVKLDYKHIDVVAKTGTMDYVRGLAGYIATPSGRRLAFAIFSNDIDRRDGEVQRIDKRWMARAREFERGLIRDWIKRLG